MQLFAYSWKLPAYNRAFSLTIVFGSFFYFLTIAAFLVTATRSIQIDYRQRLFLGGINFQLQIQNRAATRINCHYRDRSVGISVENLSLQIYRFSLEIPVNFHYRYRFRARNELIL